MRRPSNQKKRKNDNIVTIAGVDMYIDWADIQVGSSFFVPTAYPQQAKQVFYSKFKQVGWKLKASVRIENHIFGLRIWRIL